MSAKEFQQSAYFDNILISTIRFLDSLPAKTPHEKSQFMRGLSRVLPSFPKSVLEKKVLPALLEEMKDRELLALILQNVFKIIDLLPSGRRAFTEKILPRFREIFLLPSTAKGTPDRDPAKEAGLMVLLENISVITNNCSGKEFKDEILPIIHLAIESPTHSLVDSSLRSLPIILPFLDFSTIKNELFPVIATVFSKTSSLGIKVRGLEAFVILCGGSADAASNDGLDGIMNSTAKKSSSTALDKYTMQEKIVPLVRAIKTKEPAVAIAALNVLRVVGGVADADFVAMDILPVLWSMSLGPLLNLTQFQSFTELIKNLSSRVEAEQTKKLQELSGTNGSGSKSNDDFMSFGATSAFPSANGGDSAEIDFERLVKGDVADSGSSNPLDAGWDAMPSNARAQPQVNNQPKPASFAWSTPSPTTPSYPSMGSLKPQQPVSRTITPDLSRFDTLSPTTTQFSQPLQPHSQQIQPFQTAPIYGVSQMSNYTSSTMQPPPKPQPQPFQSSTTSVNWGAAASNPWASNSTNSTSSLSGLGNSMGNMSLNQQRPAVTSQSSSVPSESFSIHLSTNSYVGSLYRRRQGLLRMRLGHSNRRLERSSQHLEHNRHSVCPVNQNVRRRIQDWMHMRVYCERIDWTRARRRSLHWIDKGNAKFLHLADGLIKAFIHLVLVIYSQWLVYVGVCNTVHLSFENTGIIGTIFLGCRTYMRLTRAWWPSFFTDSSAFARCLAAGLKADLPYQFNAWHSPSVGTVLFRDHTPLLMSGELANYKVHGHSRNGLSVRVC